MQLISLRDALAILDSGQPCTVTFVTCDRRRKRGGELLTYEACVWVSTYWKKGIRNVRLPNKKVRPIHIWLITQLNGKKVIW